MIAAREIARLSAHHPVIGEEILNNNGVREVEAYLAIGPAKLPRYLMLVSLDPRRTAHLVGFSPV